MNAIRMRKKLDSATPHWPELEQFIGKTVEIIILEESEPTLITPGTGDFANWPKLIEEIREQYDLDAVADQRNFDLLHANDHAL